MFNYKTVQRLVEFKDSCYTNLDEFLRLEGERNLQFDPLTDFEMYLSQFRKTKAEQDERAKIEAIILSLVKKSALKD